MSLRFARRERPRRLEAAAFVLLAGCSWLGCGPSPAPTNASLMDKTTVGQNRCVSQGDQTKLFVVEWDATDASTFEALADRDLVFVRYEGCELTVIDGCRDGSLAGRYGTYREPTMTSGSAESFLIRNQDELGAKLPLSAVTLGGAVTSEQMLELEYHVAGSVMSTRDEVYRHELADNPRCVEATHVIWAYSLGAYRLFSRDALATEADVGIQGLGVSGSHEESQSALRRAGEFEACRKIDNHGCQVPIRLTLRPIHEGASPAVNALQAPGAAPTDGAASPAAQAAIQQAQTMMSAMQYRASAEQKMMAHDGLGCLGDLDRADAADPQGRASRLQLRAMCTMRAGRCDEGKELLRQERRAFYRDNDPTGLASEATIEHEVEQMAAQQCATAAGGGKSVLNNAIGITQQILVASASNDTAKCVSLGKQLKDQLAASADPASGQLASAGLQKAADCAAVGGECDAARTFYVAFAKHFLSFDEEQAIVGFEQQHPGCR